MSGGGRVAAPATATATATVTIVLADAHRIARAGLRLLLEREPGLRVVGEAGTIAQTEREVAARRPQVLILDPEMPDGPPLPAIGRIRRGSPRTGVVVLSADADPGAEHAALAAGAAGYVRTDAAESELLQVIRDLAAGRTRRRVAPGDGASGAAVAGAGASGVGAAVADAGASGASVAVAAAGASGASVPAGASAASPTTVARPRAPNELTPREREVLGLIARGHTNGEIAQRLFLSVRTVESHRAHIQHKSGCGSRAQLVAYAQERGII